MRNLFPYIVALGLAAGCVTGSVNQKKMPTPRASIGKCYESPSSKSKEGCKDSTEQEFPTVYNPEPTKTPKPELATSARPSKTQIDIYFDPLCEHCDDYLRMVDERDFESRFGSEYDFNRVCVELPSFRQDERCRRKYGQDGRKNYDSLVARCEAGKSDDGCGGTPTVFVGNRHLPQYGWKLEQELERR